MMKVSLLFPSWNRLEFTKVAFQTLLDNTNPKLVTDFVVIDACSEDGTFEYLLQEAAKENRFQIKLLRNEERHIVSTMHLGARYTSSEWIAKIDSDTVTPPGWLDTCLDLMKRHPEVWALGVEPFTPFRQCPRKIARTRHIGGIGVFRRSAWKGIRALTPPFSGWLEHQLASPWAKAWVDPPLRVSLLNRLPFDPWISLSKQYERRGWQRPWPRYKPECQWQWAWKFPHWKTGTL